MLLGLSGGTATVSAGKGGSTTITQSGKPNTIVLPGTLAIVARPSTVKPTKPAAPAAPLASIAGALGKLDPKKTLLILGGLGVVVWGALQLGLFKDGGRGRGRRSGRRRRSSRYARNPRGLQAEYEDPDVRRAIDFRKAFHWGFPAKAINRRRVSEQPRVLVELGEIKSITYKTNKQGERAKFFVHDFESTRPTLGMDIRNKRLHFVGGAYTVTDDGITG